MTSGPMDRSAHEQPPSPIEANGDSRSPSSIQRLPRVLCVDDERMILSTLARVLKRQADVVTSTSPLEAVERVKQDRDFAVVIADVNMPDMDGYDFIEVVRELLPNAAHILLTGTTANLSSPPSNTAFRVLGKPCAISVLRHTVAQAIAHHAFLSRRSVRRRSVGTSPQVSPVSVRSVSETNDVLVNGTPVACGATRSLEPGDHARIASEDFEIGAVKSDQLG